MKRIITIEGMTCNHCTGRVKKNLSALPGVSAVDVELASGKAFVESDESVTDSILRASIDESGYDVLSITRPD